MKKLMKTKNIFYLVVAVCLLLLASCRPKPDLPDQFRQTIDQLQQDMVDKYLNHSLVQLRLENRPVGAERTVRTLEKNSVRLADLPGPSAQLIFRYSEVHCNSCIDLVVQKLNALYRAGFTRMAIIASYNEYRHFSSFVRANQLEMPVYLMEEEDATGIFDTEIPPYLFVLDQSGRVAYPFVPIKEMEAGVDLYLDFVRGKLQKDALPVSRANPAE
jgi:hypothetical protein